MTVTMAEALSTRSHTAPRIIVESDPEWPARATLMLWNPRTGWERQDSWGGCSADDAVTILRGESSIAFEVDREDVWVIAQ